MQESKEPEQKKEEREQVVELGSDLTRSRNGNIYTLTIIGQVEGHQIAPDNAKTTKYEHVLPLLAGIEESDEIDGLLLLLNTVGGDIEAGLAIAEMIAGMKKPSVSLVLGGGHSIGIPLAVCAKKSFITPTASMTIHPVRMTGLVVGAPQTFRYFQRIQEQITEFVTANSKISKEDFEGFMMAVRPNRPPGRPQRRPDRSAQNDQQAAGRRRVGQKAQKNQEGRRLNQTRARRKPRPLPLKSEITGLTIAWWVRLLLCLLFSTICVMIERRLKKGGWA